MGAREIAVRDLRRNLAAVLSAVADRHQTVYVTSRGRRIAAIVPIDSTGQHAQEDQR
jgi:prevent-host-death family protein